MFLLLFSLRLIDDERPVVEEIDDEGEEGEEEGKMRGRTDFDVSKCVSFHMFFFFVHQGNEDVQTRHE